MNYEMFYKQFKQLPLNVKIKIYNLNCENDEGIYENNEKFLNSFFKSPFDAILAVCGNKYMLEDAYVLYDGDNFVSLSENEVEEEIMYCIEEIFECEDSWREFIHA